MIVRTCNDDNDEEEDEDEDGEPPTTNECRMKNNNILRETSELGQWVVGLDVGR